MRKIKLRNYYLLGIGVLIVGNSEHYFPDNEEGSATDSGT